MSANLSVGKGAAFLYIEQILAIASGYLFWLVLTKITTPEIIGTVATIVSLTTIFATILSFGIPNSIPRFLGVSFSKKQLEEAKVFVEGSIFIVSIGTVAGTIIILVMKDYWILDGLGFDLIILTIVLMAATAIGNLFRYIVISSLKTKMLVSQYVISSVVKFALSIVLLLLNSGATGLTIGYTSGQVVYALLIGLAIVEIFKQLKNKKSIISFGHVVKSILIAGIPGWIPALLTTIGAQLGTIIIFGSTGTAQAGAYYILFSIFMGIASINNSLLLTAFPILSAKDDGRKRLTWRLTKISLVISVPLAFSLLFYSQDVLGLLGTEYSDGSSSLQVLLLSVLPVAVITGVNTLVYSYGNYRQVLLIGLASSIPRTLLYFLFVPEYGATGAGMSYTMGSVIGFCVSIVIARGIGLQIIWKDLIFILVTSSGIALIFALFEINYILAIPCTLIITYVLLVRLRVLTRTDIHDTLGILPSGISSPLVKRIDIICKKLSRSY